MPFNAYGWTLEEDEKLVELVQPHTFLYNGLDPSRKNILTRESTWKEIAQELEKPVEECKKRWRGLRDAYMRSKRLGTIHNKAKAGVFEKLQFLDEVISDMADEEQPEVVQSVTVGNDGLDNEQVVTDKQEYYEITVVDAPVDHGEVKPQIININNIPNGVIKRKGGRKRNIPMPQANLTPIKILPKPIMMNNTAKVVRYIEDPKKPEPKSQMIDKLIERVLKENTNEIDVFFRSMAASVKKLPPTLIPKVKMEVCNVIAKYEMQSFDKGGQQF